MKFTYNREVIKNAEINDEGWLVLEFNPPHPIPQLMEGSE